MSRYVLDDLALLALLSREPGLVGDALAEGAMTSTASVSWNRISQPQHATGSPLLTLPV